MSPSAPGCCDQPVVLLALHRIGPYHRVRLEAASRLLAITAVETRPLSQEYPWAPAAAPRTYQVRGLAGAADPETDPPGAELHRQWAELLDQIRPAVVVSVGWADAAYQVLLLEARRAGVPLVIVSDSRWRDEPRSAPKEWIKRQLLRGYSAALVAGQESRAYLQSLGFPAAAIQQPWDVVDNQLFSDAAQRHQAEPGPSPHLLCVSRFVAKKNHRTLLQAYARYQSEGGQWGLRLIGHGPLEAEIRGLIADLPFPGRCRLDPFLQLEPLARAYAQAMAFVLASTSDQWGLVVNEAIAAGLPVLVSTGCGCAIDLVDHGRTGLCFDPADPRALADQLHALEHMDTEQRRALVAAAQQRLQAFTPEAFAIGLERAVARARQRPRRSWRSRAVAGALSSFR